MARTVRDALVSALEDLGEGGLKRFRNKLNDCSIQEGYSKIPKGRLEKADADDVADLIRSFYKDDYGVELTLAVLKDINEKKVAQELESDLAKVAASGCGQEHGGPDSTSEASSAPQPQKEHFVDKHREALIQRVPMVSGILDSLLAERVLQVEDYDTIRVQRPSQEQMRQLYQCMKSWGVAEKDLLYQVLKEKNGPLVRDLERC